jgi:hypothetical protein
MRFGDRITIFGFSNRWVIMHATRLRPQERAHRIAPSILARNVPAWCHDPTHRRDMLDLYEEVTGDRLRPPTTDDVERRVIPTLMAAFERGRLIGIETPRLTSLKRETEEGIHARPQVSDLPEIPQVPKAPPRIISEKTFLDVSLVDSEGAPLAGRSYKLQLPNGMTEQGRLGSDGRLRKTNIDPGTARLTILAEKGEPVEAADVPEQEAVSFVEVELVDANNAPVAGQRYQVEFPDGRVETGTLDANGLAFIEGVPKGDCEISFPDLDSSAWGPADAEADA